MPENEEGMQSEEDTDFRRWSDKILYWQERPYVYPFSDDTSGLGVKTAPAATRYTTMYASEFVTKPITVAKMRPTSIFRRNKPHPRTTFHIAQVANKSVPVVRTRMTRSQLDYKPVTSPLTSNTHRTYRGLKLPSADRARPVRSMEKPANGIVPEIPLEDEEVETRLFPCIPRNTRMTADNATKLANAVIKTRKNKNQKHLKGTVASILEGKCSDKGPVYPYLPVKDLMKPGLKPLKGRPDALAVPSWNGSPLKTAPIIYDIYGRKRESLDHREPRIDAIVPDLPGGPNSKELMFKEYCQYPKYAPQILDAYYSTSHFKRIVRPYVW